MNIKKVLLSLLCLSLVISIIGCSSSGQQVSEARKTADGKIKVTFWHAMSGKPGELLKSMVDKYNAKQSKYFVESAYQGIYDEALTKLKSVGGTSEAPAIMQVAEIGTQYMLDSGYIQPVQDFIDKEKYDLSQLEPNILSYYQMKNKLYSMPFNAANAVLFYNVDKLQAVGLDPEKPPVSFEEIKQAARKLTNKEKDEKGFAVVIDSWGIEQLMANMGADLVDNGNGRNAAATKAVINSPQGLAIYKWLDEMYKEGTLGNYGRKYDDARSAFRTGKLAMYIDTSSATAGNVKEAPFKVGAGFLPNQQGKLNGEVVGGGSLWMMNSTAQEEREGAWEFMKFVTQPDTQAEWAAGTGYFPITKAAYNEQLLKDTYAKNPQFLTAVNQLQQTIPSSATKGALFSVFPEARLEVATSIERLYKGEDVQKVVDDLNKKVTTLIEDNTKVNKSK